MHKRIKEFVEILKGKDKAKGTVNQYEKGLHDYSDWLEDEGQEPSQVTGRDLQRYLSYLKNERGLAPKTIRLKFVSVSQFYKDMVANGDLDDDPTENVVVTDYAPKRTRKAEATKEDRVWIPRDDLDELVDNVPAPSLRNRLLIMFQYYTGLRRQEVCDVKLSDLDREERKVQVRGKNAKNHTVTWKSRLDGLLTAWLDSGYRDASPYARESEYLFLTESSPKLSGSRLNDIVKQAAENARLQEVLYTDPQGRKHYKITSHTLRHSLAMHWLQNDGTMGGLSEYLAHSSVTTTEIYAGILEERVMEEYHESVPNIDF